MQYAHTIEVAEELAERMGERARKDCRDMAFAEATAGMQAGQVYSIEYRENESADPLERRTTYRCNVRAESVPIRHIEIPVAEVMGWYPLEEKLCARISRAIKYIFKGGRTE